jgi:hypothetical protein
MQTFPRMLVSPAFLSRGCPREAYRGNLHYGYSVQRYTDREQDHIYCWQKNCCPNEKNLLMMMMMDELVKYILYW